MNDGELNIVFTDPGAESPELSELVRRVVESCARGEAKPYAALNVVLADDHLLHELNLQYLENDEPTDVLSFDLTDEGEDTIEGDIYISLERVRVQAENNRVTYENELARLVIHGYLHLCGWDHEDDGQLRAMMERGETYIA